MKHYKGLHHITALSGAPAINADFYINKLGLRLVKKSVNQDDPHTYHLFYANEAASPGSSVTFFPWPRAHKGKTGSGEAVNIAFMVPEGTEEYWISRLDEFEIEHSDIFTLFGKPAIRFSDPDGIELDLVFDGKPAEKVSTYEPTVPMEKAILGFWATRIKITKPEETAPILTNILGFSEIESDGNLTLYASNSNIGAHVIIEAVNDFEPGKGGRGIIHHIAFRAENEDDLKDMREKVLELGLRPTEVIDRHWFKSVYFREPSGVLFELATDDPGYAADEDFNHLGEKLVLPPWLEPRRTLIENTLPEIKV